DIIDAFGLRPENVRIVPDAVDPSFVAMPDGVQRMAVFERYGLRAGERFVLYVGGISPHKNLDTLVIAYERLRQRLGPGAGAVSLVLVGDYVADVFHSSYPAIRARIDAAGLGSSVRFAGFVPDGDLRHLYSAASALVLPSFYEGLA